MRLNSVKALLSLGNFASSLSFLFVKRKGETFSFLDILVPCILLTPYKFFLFFKNQTLRTNNLVQRYKLLARCSEKYGNVPRLLQFSVFSWTNAYEVYSYDS